MTWSSLVTQKEDRRRNIHEDTYIYEYVVVKHCIVRNTVTILDGVPFIWTTVGQRTNLEFRNFHCWAVVYAFYT